MAMKHFSTILYKKNGENALENTNTAESNDAFQNNYDSRPVYMNMPEIFAWTHCYLTKLPEI